MKKDYPIEYYEKLRYTNESVENAKSRIKARRLARFKKKNIIKTL